MVMVIIRVNPDPVYNYGNTALYVRYDALWVCS